MTLAGVLDAGDRRADDAGERIRGVALDMRPPCDRQAGREDAVDARSDQQVAVLDVGVHRHEAQFELRRCRAEDDRAQAVAEDLHRHRLILVGDQRDSERRERHASPGRPRRVVDHRLRRRQSCPAGPCRPRPCARTGRAPHTGSPPPWPLTCCRVLRCRAACAAARFRPRAAAHAAASGAVELRALAGGAFSRLRSACDCRSNCRCVSMNFDRRMRPLLQRIA